MLWFALMMYLSGFVSAWIWLRVGSRKDVWTSERWKSGYDVPEEFMVGRVPPKGRP